VSRKDLPPTLKDRLPGDLRVTRQRSEVFDVLVGSCDHPTASEVFMRVQTKAPGTSLATVYNCLETLTGCGAINQIQVDRGPARYCANLAEHVHFHCVECGSVFDAPPRMPLEASSQWTLPKGARIQGVEVTLHGNCSSCSNSSEPSRS